MMLLRLTLTVAVVCVGSLCGCVGADGVPRVVVPRDYGVKLCGREFIRAVIFTCGGSRWKRSLDMDLDLDPFQMSYGDIPEEETAFPYRGGVDLTADSRFVSQVSPSSSLADLLAVFGAGGGRGRSAGSLGPVADFLQGEQGQNPAVEWSKAAGRRKRNFSLGVAGMCCNQGCTKNDIGRLC